MKRFKLVTISFSGLLAIAGVAVPASAASHASTGTRAERVNAYAHARPYCQSYKSTCVDIYHHAKGQYVGHDEPSVLFHSKIPGSGNNMTYTVTLPSDPAKQPTRSGLGGTTWNFELRPTFWFGLTMCDNQSAPEYTKKCTPDSDSNNLVGANPKAANYIGRHPGTAYMELQFYGPGYIPQFLGFGCAATQYCAAMTIDSYVNNMNTGVANTAACNQYVLGGIEPINWAYITKSGKSQGPANPLASGTDTNPIFTSINPNYKKDLLMSPGDVIRIHMHDTPAGFQVILNDLTTGQSGKMTASVTDPFFFFFFCCCRLTRRLAIPDSAAWRLRTHQPRSSSREIGSGNCTSQAPLRVSFVVERGEICASIPTITANVRDRPGGIGGHVHHVARGDNPVHVLARRYAGGPPGPCSGLCHVLAQHILQCQRCRGAARRNRKM